MHRHFCECRSLFSNSITVFTHAFRFPQLGLKGSTGTRKAFSFGYNILLFHIILVGYASLMSALSTVIQAQQQDSLVKT